MMGAGDRFPTERLDTADFVPIQRGGEGGPRDMAPELDVASKAAIVKKAVLDQCGAELQAVLKKFNCRLAPEITVTDGQITSRVVIVLML